MVKKHNKAVRDRIPEIIRNSGRDCKIINLENSDFLKELENKLIEELNEYMESKNIEELSDLIEVIYKVAELRGYSKEKLEKIRIDKREKNGGFENNLFLLESD